MQKMHKTIRTPDDRFNNLPGFDFKPHYVNDLPGYEGIRGHYLDEGNKDAKEVFLCLHGEPTWSYLYRKMIPILVETGARVIAPDLIGFGRSDKLVDDADHSFHFHRDYLIRFIEHLNLTNITLVCQDWGGVLGLTIPPEMSERFSRLLIMNTGLMTGPVNSKAFDSWKALIDSDENVPIKEVILRNAPGISEAEAEAYEAPFPSKEYKAGPRRFPALIATHKDSPGVDVSIRAAKYWSEGWTGETFMAIGMQDKMLGPDVMHSMQKLIKNCPKALELEGAGHFVQEQGDIVAKQAVNSFGLKKVANDSLVAQNPSQFFGQSAADIKTVLVIGATGRVATEVVRQLKALPSVRLKLTSSRDGGCDKLRQNYPGSEVIKADWTDVESLKRAFNGVDRVIMIPPDFVLDENKVVPNIIEAYKLNPQIEQFIRMIALPEGVTEETMSEEFKATRAGAAMHVVGKKLLTASKLPVTYLNMVAWFTSNLPWFVAQDVKQDSRICLPGDAVRPWLTEEDMAKCFVKVIVDPAELHLGKEYILMSKDKYNFKQVAQIIGDEIGREISYLESDESLVKAGQGDLVTYLKGESKGWGKIHYHDDVVLLLGRQPKTLKEWVHENRTTFLSIAPKPE